MKKIKHGKRGRFESYMTQTRDDLRLEAKRLEIRGRGRMNKVQLAQACSKANPMPANKRPRRSA